ncbi:MAG: Rrf2 family transcriptional regulator [Patescibacteria group bacterium]|jgi:Rrf2 family protein
MFQINTRVDYGLMIMFELAQKPKLVTPVTSIAKRMQVSSIYLIQIAQSLFKAGLIKSKEGAQGGYYLAKPAGRISILQILEALEGKIEVSCTINQAHKCPNMNGCRIRSIWGEILPDIKTVLKKRSLASLLK